MSAITGPRPPNVKQDMSEEDIEREVIIGWIEDREAYVIRADKILEGKEPYFKFYDSDELETSEHVARISFTRVGYIEGGEDGLPGFKLNKKQVKIMVEFFESECQEENYRECTYWQYGIVQYNKENVDTSRDWKEVTKKYLEKHPEEFDGSVVLPIDLEMPDYLNELGKYPRDSLKSRRHRTSKNETEARRIRNEARRGRRKLSRTKSLSPGEVSGDDSNTK